MNKRYKRVMKLSGAGLLISLAVALLIRSANLEPLLLVGWFGFLCAAVFIGTPIVWANLETRRIRDSKAQERP